MKHAIPSLLAAGLFVAGVAAYVTQPEAKSYAAAPARAAPRPTARGDESLGLDPVLRFPVLDGGNDQTFVGGAYFDVSRGCARWYTGTQWTCMADVDQVGSSLVAAREHADGVADAGAQALAARAAELESRIDAVSMARQVVCDSASVVGISIPVLGISPPTTIPVAGAQANRPCLVIPDAALPALAVPRCDVTSAGTTQLRFYAANLLGALAIPTGTYTTCVVNP